MRNISCGCSSGIAEIFSSVTVAAGKRFPKSTTIATKTVLGNLIMCNLPPDSQQALAIFEDDLLSRLLGRSPWFSCVPTVITNSRPLQVTLAQFQSIFERSYLAVVCDSVEPPPVIVIVHGSPRHPMQALNCHGGLLSGSCYRRWNECILRGKDWEAIEKIHQAYAEEKKILGRF